MIEVRCTCAACRDGDTLPERLQGWPGAYQLMFPWDRAAMTHRWYWRALLGERKDQLCRVLARGKLNSALVEFDDGYRVITSRYAVRKLRP